MPATTVACANEDDYCILRIRVDGAMDDPAALGAALDALIRETRDIEGLLLRGPEFGTESDRFYGFRCVVTDAKGETLDEEPFFARVTQLPELDQKALAYVGNILRYNEGTRSEAAWHDEEYPAGTFAIEPLALRERRYVRDYVRFLATNDMGHEVHQGAFLDRLIARWGWYDETRRIAAMRLGSACGQAGPSQFAAFCTRDGLLDYLRGSGEYDAFARDYEPHHTFGIARAVPGQSVVDAKRAAFAEEWDLLESIAGTVWDGPMQEALRERIKELVEAAFRDVAPGQSSLA